MKHKMEFTKSVDTLKIRKNMTVDIPDDAVGIKYNTNDGKKLDKHDPEKNAGRYLTHFKFL